MRLYSKIRKNLISIPGWRTKRKIVVIESDDWGSIRMPSKIVYDELFKRGFLSDNNEFNQFDNLASTEDLTLLFKVLRSVKDKNGNPAIITANTIVANPDFDRIESSDFTEYYYKPFTETLKEYGPKFNDAFDVWNEGINGKIWHPQFHGREHVNVNYWIKMLQDGDKNARFAFSKAFYAVPPIVLTNMEMKNTHAFGNIDNDSLEFEKNIIHEGTKLFETIFGFRSKSFIAPAYTWRSEIESVLKSSGVKYIQGLPFQHIPIKVYPVLRSKSKYHYLGQKNKHGQYYLVRNCFFEPYKKNSDIDWVENCLYRMKIAFRFHKPAIISTHRVNFIGSLVPENRDKNLELFSNLLNKIIERWPEIEFKTSDQLGDLIAGKGSE